MSLLVAKDLAKAYGPDEIFAGISAEIPHKARIALVGPNGAGKTTLINILAGLDSSTAGGVTLARGTQIGFLPQRPELAGQHTLWEEALRAVEHLRRMEARLSELEHALADSVQHDAALAEYGRLQEQFEQQGGYTYETRLRAVLQGVGFKPDDFQMPLPKLSGGQKTRALLARLLLEAPDLLVMDEPTNHLDIQAVEWLEGFLKDFPGAVLAVSHDRYFMDNFASTIWELDFGELEVYRGNYSHYVQQREARHERLLKEYTAQQEFLAKEQEFIRRNMGSRGTSQAKGRLKRLETMAKRGKVIMKPRSRQTMHLRMESVLRSGNQVLVTRGLSVGYPDADAPLFSVPDIVLMRGETAALIGPNGVGKSTFLKTVLGQLNPLAGEAKLGAAVKIGYFAQAHELLDPAHSIMDEIQTVKPMPLSEARSYLGKFLFSGDDAFRQVSTLSGGERGRVALAKLALSGANFLLLDEPTNHLDIESQEILQSVLENYDGTILIVSHDRYLIDALGTQIWAAEPGKMTVYRGTYQDYLAMRAGQEAFIGVTLDGDNPTRPAAADTGAASTRPAEDNGKPRAAERRHGLNPYQLKKRVAELEAAIHTLEARLAQITAAIERASTAGDAAQITHLGEEYRQAEWELDSAMSEWAELAE